MKLTALSKLILFILAVGAAFGGWRWWQQQQAMGGKGGVNVPGVTVPGGAQQTGGTGSTPESGRQQTTSGTGSAAAGGDTGSTPSGQDNEISFVITAAKQDWVGEQVARFNDSNGGKWRIVTTALPSREAMHNILSGSLKPVLWSPGSPLWPSRLGEAWSEKGGGSILDMSDPNAYRVFLRSPLVFLTTKQKAKFLRPLLGGTEPWAALRRLSLGQQKVPWGKFRFSHADPLASSSGMLTLGLIMADYGQRSGQSGDLNSMATDRRFLTYLGELERSLVFDKPAHSTTKLTAAFIADPDRYDVITAYESAALQAAPANPNLAVIYPNPTSVSEHAVSLLSAPWVTETQRAGALEFIKFLGGKEALQAGLKYHFRPAQTTATLSLQSELARYGAQGFQNTFSTIDLPPYQGLNAAAYRWSKQVSQW